MFSQLPCLQHCGLCSEFLSTHFGPSHSTDVVGPGMVRCKLPLTQHYKASVTQSGKFSLGCRALSGGSQWGDCLQTCPCAWRCGFMYNIFCESSYSCSCQAALKTHTMMLIVSHKLALIFKLFFSDNFKKSSACSQ